MTKPPEPRPAPAPDLVLPRVAIATGSAAKGRRRVTVYPPWNITEEARDCVRANRANPLPIYRTRFRWAFGAGPEQRRGRAVRDQAAAIAQRIGALRDSAPKPQPGRLARLFGAVRKILPTRSRNA